MEFLVYGTSKWRHPDIDLQFSKQTYMSGNCQFRRGFCSHRSKCHHSGIILVVGRGLNIERSSGRISCPVRHGTDFPQDSNPLKFREAKIYIGKLSGSSSVQSPYADCVQMWLLFPRLLSGMLKHCASNSLCCSSWSWLAWGSSVTLLQNSEYSQWYNLPPQYLFQTYFL